MTVSPWKAGTSGWTAMASSSRFAEGAFFRDANAGTHKHRGLELGATLAATDDVDGVGECGLLSEHVR